MFEKEDSMGNAWKETLDDGDVLLIDGGMGPELQRRGVPMDKVAWSGAAVLTHPDSVREAHEDYIRAGAKVIITNTFGSTRQMLEPAGYGNQVEAIDRGAVKLASQLAITWPNRPWPLQVRFQRSPPDLGLRPRSSGKVATHRPW
jgi:S-methylmethionine-dependent homocysteine/selenocysteine methylase